MGSNSGTTEGEGGVRFIPSDGEGRCGAGVDEAVTLLVSLDDGDGVAFNGVLNLSGGQVEDGSGSGAGLEVAESSVDVNVSALTSGGGAVSARLLGA